eukprot:2353695-Pleurochrysis_carterae.AAC.1
MDDWSLLIGRGQFPNIKRSAHGCGLLRASCCHRHVCTFESIRNDWKRQANFTSVPGCTVAPRAVTGLRHLII